MSDHPDAGSLLVTRIPRPLAILVAALIGASLMIVPVPGSAPLPATPAAQAAAPGQSKFTQVQPFRLMDTRAGGSTDDGQYAGIGKFPAGSSQLLRVAGRGGVPANATAVVLNVTATAPDGPGYVTAYPAGQSLPNTSNVNVERKDQTIANLVTVQLGGQSVALFTNVGTHLVVDVFGYYTPSGSTSAGRFEAYGPYRIIDTRNGAAGGYVAGGTSRVVPMPANVPSDATAVVVNITITDGNAGYWTAYAAGTPRPSTSNVNIDVNGRIVPNQAVVPVSAAGIQVYSEAGGNLLVDLAGWYTGASAPSNEVGLFVPITPQRLLDTRTSPDPLGQSISLFHGWSMEMPVIGRAGINYGSAVALNLTATNSFAPGFVTAWPAGQARPNTSSLNLNRGGQTVAGHVVMRLGEPGISLYSYGGTDLIADAFGWFTGSAVPRAAYLPANQRPDPISFPGLLEVPAIGLSTRVLQGVEDAVVNIDPGHLTESSAPNQPGNVAIFGHRESHGQEFKNLNRVPNGSAIRLTIGGTTFVYKVTTTDIVYPDDVSLYYSGSNEQTITLIACHPPHSTALRIVVRGTLVGVEG